MERGDAGNGDPGFGAVGVEAFGNWRPGDCGLEGFAAAGIFKLGMEGLEGSACGRLICGVLGAVLGIAGRGAAGPAGMASILSPPRQALGLDLSEPPIAEPEALPDPEMLGLREGTGFCEDSSSARPISSGWDGFGAGAAAFGMGTGANGAGPDLGCDRLNPAASEADGISEAS